MFNITQEMLLNLSSSEIFEQGREYYRARRIKSVQFNQDKLAFNATVLGTRLYDVRLQFEAAGRLAPISAISTAASPKPSTETASVSKPASVGSVLYSCSGTCTCSDFAALVDVGGFCKHLIALLLLIEEKDKQGFFRELRFRQAAKEIFSFFGGKQAVLTSQVTTEAFFELPRNDSHGKAGIPMLSLRLGQDKLYVVKDLKRLMENIERNEDLQLGRKFTCSPSRHVFDKADQPLIDLIFASYETSKLMETFSPLVHGTGFFRGKQLLLTDSAVKRFFEMTAGRPFRARLHDMDFDDLTVVEKDIPVEFQLGGEGSDLLLNISIEGVI
ncbi:MAG: hypothetical protein HGA22_14950, partial [Clostridiales bacterium]|nr:hypothetical protein [Clostridiales bacterium]